VSPRAPKSQQSGAAAAGGTVCRKTVNNEGGGPAENPGHCPFPVHFFPSGHFILTQASPRGYKCALIVHSWAVDPQCTASMVEEEQSAQQYFEELKDLLQMVTPHLWRIEFKFYISRFIDEKLRGGKMVSKEPEIDYIYLYGLWRLMAGAFQELELAQQPKHAAMCAKINGAFVWQGRGYVSQILYAISSFQPYFQS